MSIFEENIAYKPFKYPWAVEMERVHRIDMHWHEDQIDLQDDLVQYFSKDGLATKDISHEVNKNLLDKLLMLFTEMDLAVGSGYTKLLPHVKNNEIRTMMITFACREVTHQRSYALSAETFGFTNSDWSEFREYKEMSDKIDLMTQDVGDLSKPLNFAKYLSVLLLGEGISLFGAFACLLNLSRFGLTKGFNTINEYSLKEEGEHVKGNIKTLYEVRRDLSEAENEELDRWIDITVESYVEAECKFLDLVYEMGDQQDLTLGQTKDFIEYLGELRKYQLGLISVEAVRENPLKWIDYILSASSHTNFFESKEVNYTHNGLEGEIDYNVYQKCLVDRTLT